jgi:hypothetical protein
MPGQQLDITGRPALIGCAVFGTSFAGHSQFGSTLSVGGP